jgi:hypothetical protein
MTGPQLQAPERWFREFCLYYRKRERDPESELSLSGNPSKCTGWTASMGVFLARLGYQFGYWQDWEVGAQRVDFGWFKRSPNLPDIAIEHECWHSQVFGKERRVVTKLARSRGALRVLITYAPGNWTRRSDDRYLNRIRELLPRDMGKPLLVILANDGLKTGEYSKGWRAYTLWGTDYNWTPIPNPLSH